MSDDLKNRGPTDRSRINVHEPWELEWWTKHFNVTADRLRDAVRQVGVSADRVRAHLGR